MVPKTTSLNPAFQRKNQWDIGKNVSGLVRDFCYYKQQNPTTKNENGVKKNVHIFKSNAPILLKLGVGFDHMYTKGWICLDPFVYCTHGIRQRASFVDKVT